MGLHWINPSSPEFHQLGFTRTFIFGSWDGRFTFLEPMVTRDYLLQRPDDLVDLPRLGLHDPAGYYPTAYRVQWDADSEEWRVALAGLVKDPK
jgi:hypothetical protein